MKSRMKSKFMEKLGPLKVKAPEGPSQENEGRNAIDCDHIFGDIYISGKS